MRDKEKRLRMSPRFLVCSLDNIYKNNKCRTKDSNFRFELSISRCLERFSGDVWWPMEVASASGPGPALLTRGREAGSPSAKGGTQHRQVLTGWRGSGTWMHSLSQSHHVPSRGDDSAREKAEFCVSRVGRWVRQGTRRWPGRVSLAM